MFFERLIFNCLPSLEVFRLTGKQKPVSARLSAKSMLIGGLKTKQTSKCDERMDEIYVYCLFNVIMLYLFAFFSWSRRYYGSKLGDSNFHR